MIWPQRQGRSRDFRNTEDMSPKIPRAESHPAEKIWTSHQPNSGKYFKKNQKISHIIYSFKCSIIISKLKTKFSFIRSNSHILRHFVKRKSESADNMSNMCAVIECRLLFMSLNPPNSEKCFQGHDLCVLNGPCTAGQIQATLECM